MGRFNRDFNRRHPAAPPRQRGFQWDEPQPWRDWNAQEQYWRHSLPNGEQPYWRVPPPSQEEHHWRRNSSQAHYEDRGRPVYRDRRPRLNQGEPAVFNRIPREYHQSQPPDCIDQQSHRANLHDSATMSSKKEHTACAAKLSGQDDVKEISQVLLRYYLLFAEDLLCINYPYI